VHICIWPSRCQCHSLSLSPVNPDWFYLPGFYLSGSTHPDKIQKSHKTIVCVCVCVLDWKMMVHNSNHKEMTHHISIGVEYSTEPNRTSGGRYLKYTTCNLLPDYLITIMLLSTIRPNNTASSGLDWLTAMCEIPTYAAMGILTTLSQHFYEHVKHGHFLLHTKNSSSSNTVRSIY